MAGRCFSQSFLFISFNQIVRVRVKWRIKLSGSNIDIKIQLMASKYLQKFPVPKGFPEILSDFAREVLRDQPQNIIEYGAHYFEAMQKGQKPQFKSEYNVKRDDKKYELHYDKRKAEEMTKKAQKISGGIKPEQIANQSQGKNISRSQIQNNFLEINEKQPQQQQQRNEFGSLLKSIEIKKPQNINPGTAKTIKTETQGAQKQYIKQLFNNLQNTQLQNSKIQQHKAQSSRKASSRKASSKPGTPSIKKQESLKNSNHNIEIGLPSQQKPAEVLETDKPKTSGSMRKSQLKSNPRSRPGTASNVAPDDNHLTTELKANQKPTTPLEKKQSLHEEESQIKDDIVRQTSIKESRGQAQQKGSISDQIEHQKIQQDSVGNEVQRSKEHQKSKEYELEAADMREQQISGEAKIESQISQVKNVVEQEKQMEHKEVSNYLEQKRIESQNQTIERAIINAVDSIFQKYDKSMNGYLQGKEIQALLQDILEDMGMEKSKVDAKVIEDFKHEVDTSHDNKLTKKELTDFIKRIQYP